MTIEDTYTLDPWAARFADEREAAAAPPGYRPETLWAWARQDYADGLTAERICSAYGLAKSTFRTRARREGWRRSDLAASADPDVERLEVEPPPAAPPTPDFVVLAWNQAADAIRRGEAYKARAFMKLHYELKEAVKVEQAVARRDARLAAEAETPAPELHSLHPDVEAPDALLSPSRAEPHQEPIAWLSEGEQRPGLGVSALDVEQKALEAQRLARSSLHPRAPTLNPDPSPFEGEESADELEQARIELAEAEAELERACAEAERVFAHCRRDYGPPPSAPAP